jgi:hypothetical protein
LKKSVLGVAMDVVDNSPETATVPRDASTRWHRLRHWDQLGHLPKTLSGSGEEELIAGPAWSS